MQIRAADVISHAEILKDITSKLQTYDEQAIDNSDIFKKDDQGNLLYNQIFNNIVLQYNQTGDIEEALKNNPFDANDVLISSNFEAPDDAYAKDLNGNTDKYEIGANMINQFPEEMQKDLTNYIIFNTAVDENGKFNNNSFERIMTGKNKATFLLDDGSVVSADAREMFYLEKNSDTGAEPNPDPSDSVFDEITPTSESFNPDTDDKEKKYDISQEEIQFLTKDSEVFRDIGVTGLQLKGDKNMFASAPADSPIQVSVTKDDLKRIKGQNIGEDQGGPGYDQYFLGAKDVENEKTQSVKATITSIGILPNTNQPVAVMKFGNAEFAVPLSEVTTSKLIKAFPKGTVGNTIIEYSKFFSQRVEKDEEKKGKKKTPLSE